MSKFKNPTFWGVSALVLLAVFAVTAAGIYVNPPGRNAVEFYTDDVASIRVGDDVRIAGITVGKIKGVSMEQDQVKVRALVDGDAFVGDQSQVEVRMLTIVGGYYVNLISLGDHPLGRKAIPRERTTMPYSLMRALADSTKVTEGVNPKQIRESLDELEAGLTGTNVEALSTFIDAGNTLTATIDSQRGQISQILDLSDEYIETLKNYGGKLTELVNKLSILEQTLVIYGKGFAGAMKGMGDIADAFLAPYGKFWVNHREDFILKVREWQDRVRRWADNNSRIVPRLRRIRDKIERVLDAQNARPELLATDLCIPLPGSPC